MSHQRFDYMKHAASAYKGLVTVEMALHQQTLLEPGLIDLIKLRVSQINGCAYCIDVHSKDLRARGDTELRLYGLNAWEECPYYTDRERAALAWAEAITNLGDGHVPDEVYERVRAQFDEDALSFLTFACAVINAWNRIAIPSRQTPGNYVSNVK
ncbi:MAG: carboxymuconolactone decarboxylase family protein [Kofleriaceae bacterium]